MVPVCSQVCKIAMKVLNIHVTSTGTKNLIKLEENESFLMVSNHLSYLDILILTSCVPSSFVTSVETQTNPLLGPICKAGGSLFVERRKKFTLKKEIEMIKDVLMDGIRVCIFPEATSSNGEQVLPFKKALLESALRAEKTILPVCIQYKKINNQKITNENRDSVYYYGNMSFLPHMLRLVKVRSLEVNLCILEPLPYPYHHKNRDEIGGFLYEKISEKYAS